MFRIPLNISKYVEQVKPIHAEEHRGLFLVLIYLGIILVGG